MRRVPTLAFRRVGQNGSDMVSRQARKVPQDDGRSAHHVGAGSDHGLAHSHTLPARARDKIGRLQELHATFALALAFLRLVFQEMGPLMGPPEVFEML